MSDDSVSMSVVRHPTIRDQIATTVRNLIITLELTPGQLLVERELTELTGASRPSVREALRQLEAEGLIESHNGRGTYVRRLTRAEAVDVYEVRAELEGLAARLFCERAQPKEFDALETALRSLTEAIVGNAGSRLILEAQAEFYRTLFSGARNPVLERTISGLQVQIAQLRALTLAMPARDRASLAEFTEIFDAISSRNGERAQRVASRHVQNAAVVMVRAYDEDRLGDAAS